MGVCGQPGILGACALELIPDGNDVGYLKPPEQPMYRRCARHVPPSAGVGPLYRTGPAEEEKQVACPHAVSCEVAPGDLNLSERRSPFGPMWKRIRLRIRIQMTPIFSLYATPSQVFHGRSPATRRRSVRLETVLGRSAPE